MKDRWKGVRGLDGDYDNLYCIECDNEIYFDYIIFRHYDDLCHKCLQL